MALLALPAPLATQPTGASCRDYCAAASKSNSVRAGGVISWSTKFVDPIELPDGRKLATLRDAATYITKLPKAEHGAPEWQATMQALILVAKRGGDPMMPRIGFMRALNRHRVRNFNPDRKNQSEHTPPGRR